MTAKELIKELETLIEKHGDLVVYIPDEDYFEMESAGTRYAEAGYDEYEVMEYPERFYIKG